MFLRMSKISALMLLAFSSLPAAASDLSRPRDVGHEHRPAIGSGLNFADDGPQFYGRHHRRQQLLRQFSSASRRDHGGNIIVIAAPAAASSGGGTYVGGEFYGEASVPATESLAPMAKVITVTNRSSACSYENGVCVIRP